jgi:hypothetical protein
MRTGDAIKGPFRLSMKATSRPLYFKKRYADIVVGISCLADKRVGN